MNLFRILLAKLLPFIPKSIIAAIAKKYIAGEDVSDAIKIVKVLNQKGVKATIDYLGENITTLNQAERNKEKYIEILKEIDKHNLDSNISVKLTNFGLLLDKEICYQNVREIVLRAKDLNNFVRIDMEDSSTTSDTLNIYHALRKEFNVTNTHVGVALQAYLWRTLDDINHLGLFGSVRLCKGIYNEPELVAMKEMSTINRSYDKGLKKLFKKKFFAAIASHDKERIVYALYLIDKFEARGNCEFQMLLGVRNELLFQLADMGYQTRIYIPFGDDWYGYSIRRLKENPSMVGHIFKAFFKF